MSGSLRIVTPEEPLKKHDHLDICFGSGSSGKILRYSDPRRFGAILWHQGDPATHKLLDHLGPEPLSADFDIDYLVKQCRGRAKAIKQLIMEQSVVVGVGNIYASEALFMAGIDPRREAGRLSRKRLQRLLDAIKAVLEAAIAAGGTTLRDFVGGDGKPGYFSQELQVYGREGEPCLLCEKPLKKVVQGQRATFFCPICQK
jgi:formamidopyrimidine-DNA glycosylase